VIAPLIKLFALNIIQIPKPDKPALLPSGVRRTGRNQEIFATKAQRHERFYFVIRS